MAKKRAVIGFKGLALAPVTEDTLTAYKSSTAESIPYVGSMTKTPKESSQDLNYDDGIYAQVKDSLGEDAEIRIAEMPLADMAKYGLGVYDEATNTLEADFSPVASDYSLRCVTDTVSGLPYYWNYRCFELNTLRYDNFTTKSNNVTVCEVIMGGVLKRPQMPSLLPYAVMQEKDDGSNKAACEAFLTGGETFPATP